MKKWEVGERKFKAKGNIFAHYTQRVTNPANGNSCDFDLLGFSDWVNIVAITPEKKCVLVKQYRLGCNDFTLEIPGGAVDSGEDPIVAAARELTEETGYETSKDLIPLGVLTPNPAIQFNRLFVFLAEDVTPTGKQAFDPMEDIEITLIEESDIEEALLAGKVHHALAVAGLSLYSAFKRKCSRES